MTGNDNFDLVSVTSSSTLKMSTETIGRIVSIALRPFAFDDIRNINRLVAVQYSELVVGPRNLFGLT